MDYFLNLPCELYIDTVMVQYPIGIQTFSEIRRQGLQYIDKTKFIYMLAHGTKNNFLSRPRRFGKSLLVTTMQAYFEGKKELFKGLAIDKLETEWVEYPVIHLDLSRGKYYSIENLHIILNGVLEPYEEKYGIVVEKEDKRGYSDRLTNIITSAVKQTGKQAVILIDEYDSPMLDSMSDEDLQKKIRNTLRDFFSPLKANEGNLRFVFLTGISKFSQLSIFSELNNINNLSMKDEFAAICGFTKQEVLEKFHDGIEKMADANDMTFDEAVEKIKQRYDGYRFSPHGENIYNPYSLLNALNDKSFESYWFESGTPTFLLELMQNKNMLVPDLEDIIATRDQFDAPTERASDPVPVLYQSGYITIKHYDYGVYTLAFPNEEVRQGFNTFTLNYIAPDYGRHAQPLAFALGRLCVQVMWTRL